MRCFLGAYQDLYLFYFIKTHIIYSIYYQNVKSKIKHSAHLLIIASILSIQCFWEVVILSNSFAKISEALRPGLIDLQSESFTNKDELFSHMVDMLYQEACIENRDAFLAALYTREETGPTYMGDGIALPHGKSKTVTHPSIAFCRTQKDFNYESCGEEGAVRLIFMLAIPSETPTDQYLRVLANLSRLLVYEDFVQDLLSVENFPALIESMQFYEAKLESK